MRTQDPLSEQSPGTAVPAERESSTGSAFRLRNWRVRARLVALILVPTVAALLLGGLSVVTSIGTAAGYQRVNELAQLVDKVAGLTYELQSERDRAAWNAAVGRPAQGTAAVLALVDLADKSAAQVRALATSLRSGLGGRTEDELENLIGRLDSLEPLRKQAIQGTLLPNAVIVQYSLVIDDLLTLQEELAKGTEDDELSDRSVTLTALANARESASLQRGLLSAVLPVGRFDQSQLKDFLGALSRQENELKVFRKNATSQEKAQFDSTVSGPKVERAEFLRTLVLDRANSGFSLKGLDLTKRDDAREWYEAISEPINRMRAVEETLTAEIVLRSQTLKDAEQQRAIVVAVAIGVLLIMVLLITTAVARSLVQPLRRLRTEALEIAGHRLPDTVQRLREAGDTDDIPAIAPIGVLSRDEVGEVARAFDEVHREAVRLAGDEARLRSNVNAMFVNLSRRSQTLVERQLTLIEGLEQGEQDDQRLGNLFRLDHLATRMRRNSENLLVLAGQEPARRWGQPVPIIDVIRASLSEVEGYERVTLQVQPGAAVVGRAVNDVVHLVAELVENSVSFSSHETKVNVSSSRINGGGLMVSVSDVGIGMTTDELAQANWRLANPPVVDVSVSRRMGLFVVGRLALRHGIRVQLRHQDVGGLSAMVLLPETLLSQPNAFPAIPGMPQSEISGPMPQFGSPASGPQSFNPPAFGVPALASPTSFESTPRTSVFGADGPGVGVPPVDPFDRGTFETFNPKPGEPNLFGSGPPQRSPFDPAPMSGEPFGSDSASAKPYEIDPFDAAFDPRPFDNGRFGEAPVDTPWPGQFAPPGSTSWPDSQQESGGWRGFPAQGPFESDIDNTGPLPVVRSSPLEAEDEFLPIFAAVESDWFKRVEPTQAPESGAESKLAEVKEWSSPADAGWQAAQAASEPARGGVTSSGLPKRVPKANLVPGSADSVLPTAAAAPAPPAPIPVLSPDRVRSRLSSFQQGVRQGRAAARGELNESQGYPMAQPVGGDLTAAPESDMED